MNSGSPKPASHLTIRGASEHNLRGIDVDLPHDQLVVFVGVSGSGKSSLALDTIFRESERRFLANLGGRAGRLAGRMQRPAVARIDGVRPAIAVDQNSHVSSSRSTVGTLSEIGDELRLLFARLGVRRCAECGDVAAKSAPRNRPFACPCGATLPAMTRSLFSFNTEEGACPACRGLGEEEAVDPALLIADPSKTLREGALVPTTPNGYIVYSQVTPESMDEVCQAHGFSIDTPWCDLTDEMRDVIFYGSDRVQVAFGKHSLESRMKWSGIKAKPRELGHYRGIARVIAETLEKKRNANILRFVTARKCETCGGSRLSSDARAVRYLGHGLATFHQSTVNALALLLEGEPRGKPAAEASAAATTAESGIRSRILERAARMQKLGLGHLALSRMSATLSSGESRRLKLATQLGSELVGIHYVLDEPGSGLHPQEKAALIDMLCELRDRGNSVHVVEHDPMFEACADHLVEIGPKAGAEGGELLFSGPSAEWRRLHPPASLALAPVVSKADLREEESQLSEPRYLELRGIKTNNLKSLTVRFRLGAVNVVCGLSGTGKTSLVAHSIAPWLDEPRDGGRVGGDEAIRHVLLMDQKPIGRNARSNPATWTGIFDPIRTLFAETAAAQAAGLDKGYFSFNKKGGRCEACEGAGSETIGLMDMPSLVLTCARCNGARFDAKTLAIQYAGHSIREVLDCTVDEAFDLFSGEEKITRVLRALQRLGLGYLQLGQPAPTLSGGEAQRLKLAAKLAQIKLTPTSGRETLVVLDEVSCGLHEHDVRVLNEALHALAADGVTVVTADHDLHLISRSDWVVELGPEPGEAGGEVMFEGTPTELAGRSDSPTGEALRSAARAAPPDVRALSPSSDHDTRAWLEGVETHNLRRVDVAFEPNRLTAVTGISGSGKTSLAFETLASLGQSRFAESFSPFLRREIQSQASAKLERSGGIRATIAIRSRDPSRWTSATVGTASGIDLGLRLLFSRVTAEPGESLTASAFSFNHALGACPQCEGRGEVERCQLERLVPQPEVSVAEGALAQTKGGRLLFEEGGRLEAVLLGAAEALGINLTVPFRNLTSDALEFLNQGTGSRSYEIHWEKARAKGEAAHRFSSTWDGVQALVEAESIKKRDRKVGPQLAALLSLYPCDHCEGSRLNEESRHRRVGPWTISHLRGLEVAELRELLEAPSDSAPSPLDDRTLAILEEIRHDLQPRLDRLITLGLGYLETDRNANSLSTGEARRLDIARQLTSGLTGACYVLDEPGLGLHAGDKKALGSVLRELADKGNTVVVVDHDPALIRQADTVIDIGPGAGVHGGSVVAQGDVPTLMNHAESLTGKALRGEISFALERDPAPASVAAQIQGACDNNLQDVDLEVSFGEVLAICGVSGSGKSTLLEVLARSVALGEAVGCASVEVSQSTDVIKVDGRPLGRGPLSLVATSLEVMDTIRRTFARSDDAKKAGLKPGDFSFTGQTGRCPECRGTGSLVVALDFLPDAHSICPACEGTRYHDRVRAVRWEGVTIDQLLALDIESLSKRGSLPNPLQSACDRLTELGLGHLSLGRRCDTLSGGESQRLGIARQLLAAGSATDRRLFVFDEPSRGLHLADQADLARLFARLADRGDAVVLSEHSLPLMACADRVIELGPGAGQAGGKIVYQGSPGPLQGQDTPTGRAFRDGP